MNTAELITTASQLPPSRKIPDLQKLEFTYNWNYKLDCIAYTTLRMYNPGKFQKGRKFAIYLKGKWHHDAEVMDVKTLTLNQLNEWHARLDSGYGLPRFIDIVKKMYKGKTIDYATQRWNWVLLRKLNYNGQGDD